MALQLRRKTHESVVYIDRDSAPRIMPSGEDFILEDIPIGTRVLYPNPSIKGLPNREAAIRYALNHPLGCDPLFAQLEPGMRVTIAVDDISLPLPPMATPDIRQTILEIVCDMLAGHGVDDVHIIIANSLHRKMTEWEMKRMVGPRIFSDYYPDRYYNHDAEWTDGMIKIGETRHKEPLSINRRAAESDLLIYVNINFVPMDGGHKSVAVGLCDYESLRMHHDPQTIRDSDSYMDPARSALNHKVVHLGKIVDEQLNVFHIETAINNRMFEGQLDFFMKKEEHLSDFDWQKARALKATLDRLPQPARQQLFYAAPAAYELIGVWAGECEAVHAQTVAKCFEQYLVPVKGQADIAIFGVPYIIPLAWYVIVYLAFVIANLMIEQRPIVHAGMGQSIFLSVIGAAVVTAYDLALDPFMVTYIHAWVMINPGNYFGEQFRGFAGWMLTAFVISQTFRLLRGRRPAPTAGPGRPRRRCRSRADRPRSCRCARSS